MSEYKFAIVVGASSGMGEELVKQLARRGCRVAAVARRMDRLQLIANEFPNSVVPFAHDVNHVEQIPALFAEITGALGGLDLLIYASGIMPEIGATEFSTKKDKSIIDVNITGAVAWFNEAATRFQNTKRGTIVGIGSVAGDRGRVGQPVYNASKAFLACYLEALRNRLSRHNVRVVTIKPGPVQTEMTANLGLSNAMSAADAAALILKKANKTGEHYLKFTHRVAFYIIKRIPSWLMRRLNI